jgi:hypothetical protein
MSWDLVRVRRKRKDKADDLRKKIAKSSGRKPTFDEIFERGLEDLESEVKEKNGKVERDFMEIF